MSPSVWREWIEMSKYLPLAGGKMSPSVWREWIEIADLRSPFFRHGSPSVWREWIEMTMNPHQIPLHIVSLRVEGVD